MLAGGARMWTGVVIHTFHIIIIASYSGTL
jgi:hypothetical protein